MSDKIIKEDDNFIWYEIQCDKGCVVPKNAYFYLQPERTSPEDHIEDKLDMICDVPNSVNK